MLKTPKQKSKVRYDANVTFTTARISKNSTIEINVRDANSDDLILNMKGDVEYFVKTRIYESHGSKKDLTEPNRIETVSFWRDEYQ